MKKSIAHVTQFFHPERGYQENFVSKLNAKRGLETYIICSNHLLKWGNEVNSKEWQSVADDHFATQNNIKIIRLKKRFVFLSRIFMKGVYSSLCKINPDIVFIHGVSLPSSIVALYWASKNKKKIIMDDHMVKAGVSNPYSKQFYFFFKYIFLLYRYLFNIKFDKLIGVSSETAQFMEDNYGLKQKIDLIPLGYDKENVFFDLNEGRKWANNQKLPENKKFILYIGKCDHRKKPHDLLIPFKHFSKDKPDYNLLIVGDSSPEYNSLLKKKVNELGIEHKVCIRGAVKNHEIRNVFSCAELTIWPHGSSMSMLEAMVCLCPVIASDIDVNKERLGNGRGALFQENNNTSLVEKIEYVTKHRDSIVLKAKNWVKKYSWQEIESAIMEDILK